MSRIFLALISLAAIAVLGILLARNMSKPEDVDKAIARAEKIIGLANSQTDRTIKAARQLADRPRPRHQRAAVPAAVSVPATVPIATVHVVVEPIQVVISQSPPPAHHEELPKNIW